jgi:hypothetical protein
MMLSNAHFVLHGLLNLRVFALFDYLVDLQQAFIAVRMAAGPGTGADPVRHYTRWHSILARYKA